jgi:5-methylcytosine-specific restriction protein A
MAHMAKRHDHRSAQAAEYRKLYRTKQWRDLRDAQLAAEPLCRRCDGNGIIMPATVADHRTPHRGDIALFFDPANLQSLCAPCHDIDKGHIEAHGFSKAVGADGYPTDPKHPINRPAPPHRLQ